MGCLLAHLGLVTPRLVMVVLWIFTNALLILGVLLDFGLLGGGARARRSLR